MGVGLCELWFPAAQVKRIQILLNEMGDAYIDHVKRQNLVYLIAYEEFEKNLSPEERQIAGLAAAPLLENPVAHGISPICDLSESAVSVTPVDMAQACDTLEEVLAEQFDVPIEVARRIARWHTSVVERESDERKATVIARIAGTFLSTGNAKLTSAGLAYAVGLDALNGLGSMAEYAAKIGVSRQAVSKVAKQWQQELSLPASVHMRDDEACETYSEVQTTNHWRKQKCKRKMKLFKQ